MNNHAYDESIQAEAELIHDKLHLSASADEIAAVLTYQRLTPTERLRYVLGCSPADMPIVTFNGDHFEVH